MTQVVIVGAGIVGLACADALLQEGYRVSIVDRDPAGDKASFGNASGLGVSEVLPASVPGLLWKVPRWLVDPLGPLALKPSHFPAMVPWLWRFMRSGRPGEMQRIAAALAVLCGRAKADYRPVLRRIGFEAELFEVGALTVYESDAGFAAEQPVWDMKRRLGVESRAMSGDEARALEPELGPLVRHAVMIPEWSHFSDPKRLVDTLRSSVAARGATIETGEAVGFEGKELLLADGRRMGFDTAVVAAGAWSARLAGGLGDRVLLESERGYNTTISRPGIALRHEIIFAERQFVATPLSIGLRIGGAAEFAGLDTAPDYRRSEALVRLANRYLPRLQADGSTQWMGHRPTTADSLPVIGRSAGRGDIIHAFGHGHTGLTLGPTTGLLVVDLVAGRMPAIDISPYAVTRFGRFA
ncbi:NAD(P)/FAD-dependent oxidoreductase [Aureimonas altamirensis]|uniref:NAD(P)/FAD-dependent oxidoreductase n=1 Tax=Aureimonas altamirensis TaxID=370622 RepID=UPI0025579012|nr:FAD-binding oxidoreductase [Aureimonas altamirensis]